MTTPLDTARAAAGELRTLLAPACERIEVAGSIRRRKAEVKDIELVAVPRFEEEAGDLWGTPVPYDRLEERLVELFGEGVLATRAVALHRRDGTVEWSQRNGSAYKALEYRGIPVDLFVVRPPAQWGVIFALRTGPGDWNTKLVTECQRFSRRVAGGQVLHLGRPVPCPEEADFVASPGQPWVDPWDRNPSRVRIDPHLLAAVSR